MSWFFTSDEHYNHKNMLEYSKRLFANVNEMDEAMIRNHNSIVGPEDMTVHVGVDTNNFYPYSLEDLVTKIRVLSDNRKQTKTFRRTYV
ncbi:MAG: hypothetical protein GY710_21220 [Desulfobacteraceae bacterium]|nr:hypothetical protein [Desulfobacteraceae bacterium]